MASQNLITEKDILKINKVYYSNGLKGLEELSGNILSKENINNTNCDGSTILMELITIGVDTDDIVKVLVTDYFADINITDNYGETVLIRAINCKHFDLVKFLITAGADIDITDRRGKTFLSYYDEASLEETKDLIRCIFKPIK
jgi:ankyrin repeat protein